ncbi:hypothetical protein JL721_6664 [Aureococcus anophagefferens]|nr:hypothetical protein JL721_6664 [Aureococcus anophagefferens]
MDYFLLGKGALLVRERSLVSSALQTWASVSSGASLEASFDDDDGDGAYVFSEPSDAEEEEDVGSLAATISDATAARLAATLNRLSPASTDANDAAASEPAADAARRAVNACRSLSRRASAHARDAAARLSRLLALRRRDAKRRVFGRWLADVAGERATREARAALDRSLDAAEARRLGAVALAKALTRKVDDATAAGLTPPARAGKAVSGGGRRARLRGGVPRRAARLRGPARGRRAAAVAPRR